MKYRREVLTALICAALVSCGLLAGCGETAEAETNDTARSAVASGTSTAEPETAVPVKPSPEQTEEIRALTREEYEAYFRERSVVDGKLSINGVNDACLKELPQDEEQSFIISYDPYYLTSTGYREIYGKIMELMAERGAVVNKTQSELIAAGGNGSTTLEEDAAAWYEENGGKLPPEYYELGERIDELIAQAAPICRELDCDNCMKTAQAFSGLGFDARVMRYSCGSEPDNGMAPTFDPEYVCIVRAKPSQLYGVGSELGDMYVLRNVLDGETERCYTIQVWPEG